MKYSPDFPDAFRLVKSSEHVQWRLRGRCCGAVFPTLVFFALYKISILIWLALVSGGCLKVVLLDVPSEDG